MADIEVNRSTGAGTVHIKHGGQTTTSKVINSQTVFFDSGGEIVRIEVPNIVANGVNLANLGMKTADHDALRSVITYHGHKTSG